MKVSRKQLLIGSGLVFVGIPFVYFILRPLFFIVALFFVLSSEMKKGQRYMDSMQPSDFTRLEAKTTELLKKYKPDLHPIGVYGVGGDPIPTDLEKMGIVRIDIREESVAYVWVGGMDHTYLEVARNPDGSFVFHGVYNDQTTKILLGKDKRE